MPADPTPPLPPYLPAVLAASADAAPGVVTDVFVLHDDGCPLLAGAGRCACSPTVTRGFVLWFRKGSRWAWEMIAAAPTERAAHDAAEASTAGRYGDWCVLPAGKQP